MLLNLFAADLEGGRVSVSSLCIAAAVAPTTALRWIGRMTEAGLLDRAPDPDDRRRPFVMLTPPTRQALPDSCTPSKLHGLPIASRHRQPVSSRSSYSSQSSFLPRTRRPGIPAH